MCSLRDGMRMQAMRVHDPLVSFVAKLQRGSDGGSGDEIENSCSLDGETIGVGTLMAEQLRSAARREIAHARTIAELSCSLAQTRTPLTTLPFPRPQRICTRTAIPSPLRSNAMCTDDAPPIAKTPGWCDSYSVRVVFWP